MNRSEQDMVDKAKALLVQQHQAAQAEQRLGEVNKHLSQLENTQDAQAAVLDDLFEDMMRLMNGQSLSAEATTLAPLAVPMFDELEPIQVSGVSWDIYLNELDSYAARHDVTGLDDPFVHLLTTRQRHDLAMSFKEEFMLKEAECDRYDYMIASFSGLIAGLIDSFFVGSPSDSKLRAWSDEKVDNVVIKFANLVWKQDKKNGARLRKQPDSIASAIGFLERRFKVNYDARYASDLKMGATTLNMRPSDHHLKSLAHAPDIIGLFFSILDQFTGKASFISDGRLLRLEPKEDGTQVLQGGNVLAKLFAGFANWIGHLLSDVSGSSGVRGHDDGRRGAGIPLPFFELFQFADFGQVSHKGKTLSFADFSTKVFESGYDARHGVAMAVPVVFNELVIRLLWGLKSLFYHKNGWMESIPVGNKPTLRKMLLVGHGALCLTDGMDAYIRSGNVPILFATRLNYVAWSRFAFASMQELKHVLGKDVYDWKAVDAHLEQEWKKLSGEY
ncbi:MULTISPECIES: hypothetical protein [unclassified Exiguobacterium]|uniref:hypothetical protein n=1 Tax=unclassified Exiguobacterium TaxID=2644629 RepID=UPI00103C0281|nr:MULTISPECIES: hypothetical protein [unclassified Exiguobacterium]TCI39058.1 hypothetical protein EVJ29_00005 [Exiguobacterium sp. SH4S7]TCI48253.1 hypothetical protein EVJ31_04230 [Exiguobacterium sp. SH5S32]TCI55139.1 hypothetical protein EVJ25_04220 [Exiguobacterium sp. SH1S4]TCI74933.1 hypothetical protein EVJ23_04220 [Exiguobacterium sp. SH1S1]